MKPSAVLVGTPSDEVPDVLATGRGDVTTVYVSMSARHPEGRDAEYLEWHTLDHQPEQHRLASVRASLRLVSTPACRAARAASDERYDAVEHVMTYLFTDIAGLEGFGDLAVALQNAGRIPSLLPMVERGVYGLTEVLASPRLKIGADVLPWWPAPGFYLLIEQGESPASDLIDVPGVAGVWSATGIPVAPPMSSADNTGLQVTYCFLDDDPVETAARLRPALEKRWTSSTAVALLAAPFYPIVRHDDWSRHAP